MKHGLSGRAARYMIDMTYGFHLIGYMYMSCSIQGTVASETPAGLMCACFNCRRVTYYFGGNFNRQSPIRKVLKAFK